MDEKEAIQKIRNSFHEGISRAEITRKLQEKGYKLEYIDALIKKAKRPKKIIISLIILLCILIAISSLTYTFFFSSSKSNLVNPLSGYNIDFGLKQNTSNNTQLNIEDIEITPEFLSYLLNEVGAWKLHKNPVTLSKAIINFKISNQDFYSTISKGKITTLEGSSNKADMEFVTTKENIVKSIISDVPEQPFKDSIKQGTTQINLISSQTDLFAKGYLTLYNELKN